MEHVMRSVVSGMRRQARRVRQIGRSAGTRWSRRRAAVDWGSLRSIKPVSRVFGLDRGTAIDRVYIERFLDLHRADIRGRVLEIGESTYTRRFGGDHVSHFDVLHAVEGNADATIIGDLVSGEGVPPNAFDCMILTQTFGFIYDVRRAVATCFHALKPGGVLLATVAGISQISRFDMDRWGDFWRFTSLSARRMFAESFGADHVDVQSWGNVLTTTAYIQGVAAEELTSHELDAHDPDYELLLTIRAQRQAEHLAEQRGGA